MGMYDYLGGEQIKIFYRPIFSKDGVLGEGPATWHSGGQLRGFSEEDELPLKTLYYQYPDNFLVFDYRYDSEEVWIVENGKFKKIISYKDLTKEDIVGPVFDYYGNQLSINTIDGFFSIKGDWKTMSNKQKEIEKSFFPEGSINAIKKDREAYLLTRDDYFAALDKNREKFVKWYPEDAFRKVKDFGESIDCYIFAKERKDDEPFASINPLENYKVCCQYIAQQIENNPTIIKDYKEWLEDDSVLDEIKIDELINEIMNEVNQKDKE